MGRAVAQLVEAVGCKPCKVTDSISSGVIGIFYLYIPSDRNAAFIL
jgi:hypothetical protein